MDTFLTIYDLENFFLTKRLEGCFVSICEITVLQDSIIVEYPEDGKESAIQLLEKLLSDKFLKDANKFIILLDSQVEISVLFEEAEFELEFLPYPLKPLLRDVALLSENAKIENINESFNKFLTHTEPSSPQVHAFFSFKGGVGRTAHLTSLVQHYAENLPSTFQNPNILVIDADTEAPGITWWAQEQFPIPNYSYTDFLAHATKGIDSAVSIAQKNMQSMRLMLGTTDKAVYFMPAFKNALQSLRPPVQPEQLTFSTENPWFMGDLFQELGTALGVEHVFIDLRAGMSELSGPIFLDPRIQRTLVTTTSQQSVEGTILTLQMLAKLCKLYPQVQDKYSNNTKAIINFIPPDDGGKVSAIEEQLDKALGSLILNDTDDTTDEDISTKSWILKSGYDQTLLGLSDFSTALRIFSRSSSMQDIAKLLWKENAPLKPEGQESAEAQKAEIQKLKESVNKLIYAESVVFSEEDSDWDKQFLKIAPYNRLALDFQSAVPNVCIVGAKGSGKTFLYQLLTGMKNWKTFCKSVGFPQGQEAILTPLYWSDNLHNKERVNTAYHNCLKKINLDITYESSTSADSIENAHNFILESFSSPSENSPSEWFKKWYTFFILSLNIPQKDEDTAEATFKQWLQLQEKKIVFLFDGFEDLFSQWISRGDIEPVRLFVQNIMERIHSWSKGNVGIILFVRKDIITSAITQNTEQFLSRYKKYELLWNREEALRLVGWTLIFSKISDHYYGHRKDWDSLEYEKIGENLEPFWGKKMGDPNSKEAYVVNWVLSAMSDFKGNIQARDILRLLLVASEKQSTLDFSVDRLLSPTALKNSLKECGHKKISEVKSEVGILTSIIEKLSSSSKTIPLSRDDIKELQIETNDIQLLETFGLLFSEDNVNYYLPEMYRQGLGLSYQKGARPKVVHIMRNALGSQSNSV